jgi:hypothetical protein
MEARLQELQHERDVRRFSQGLATVGVNDAATNRMIEECLEKVRKWIKLEAAQGEGKMRRGQIPTEDALPSPFTYGNWG